MAQLFINLSQAVESTWWLAIGAAFLWGILSIILSPCHLASIPLIVGFIDEQGKITTKRALLLSGIFAGGILITIALIGLITALAGRMLGDIGQIGTIVVALTFFLVGLHWWGLIPVPGGIGQVKMKKKGLFAALVLGLFFGLALGPCSFSFMAPMLGIVYKLGTANILYGSLLLLVYGIGHCAVIVVAGTFTEIVQQYLNWDEKSRGTLLIKKICGSLIILAAAYLIINNI